MRDPQLYTNFKKILDLFYKFLSFLKNKIYRKEEHKFLDHLPQNE